MPQPVVLPEDHITATPPSDVMQMPEAHIHSGTTDDQVPEPAVGMVHAMQEAMFNGKWNDGHWDPYDI